MRRTAFVPILAACLAIAPGVARADEPVPTAASEGLAAAVSAARAWAGDAVLVYLENDEAVGADGRSDRWGYLFHSPSKDAARSWSVRNGKIVAAENLAMDFVAPPVHGGWLDSGAALAAAEAGPVAKFRATTPGVEATTMLLMRGAFHGDDPDRTTWTLVYRAPDVPALFVVVDATDGKVRRTWRG